MKKQIKRGLLAMAILLTMLIMGVSATEIMQYEHSCAVCGAAKTSRLTRADLENAVVEVAWDYFMKGVKLQYCSTEVDKLGKFYGGHYRLTEDVSPEYGTDDTTIYSVCSDYVYKVYLEALGHRILGAENSLNAITYDMWRRPEKQPESGEDVDYCVVRWKDSSDAALDAVSVERGTDTSPYFSDFGDYCLAFENDYYPTTAAEQTAQTEVVRAFLMDWENNLRPGDILCASGHAMLYAGNGYILDCTSTTRLGGGGRYNVDTGIEKLEHEGAVWRLSTMDWLTGWIFNEEKRDWFVVIRPTKGMVLEDGDGDLGNDVVIDPTFALSEATRSRMTYPAMEIDRTASVMPYNTVVSGEELTYSVKITNGTSNELYIQHQTRSNPDYQPVDYKGVSVTETIPAGTKFVSATGDYKQGNGKLSWTVDVPAGQTVEVTYTVQVTADIGDTITNGGGFVASIPSNELTHTVGGKKPGEMELGNLAFIANTDVTQWPEMFGISVEDSDLDFADRIYQQMGIDLELPTLSDLVPNIFNWEYHYSKSRHTNYKDGKNNGYLFTVNNAPTAGYQRYRDMLVENYWGGYQFFVGEDKFGTGINELRAEYLELGDIMVYVTSSTSGNPVTADILIYAGLNSDGEPVLMERNGTAQALVVRSGQAARDRIWNAFMSDIDLFFVLRPTQGVADIFDSSEATN